MQWKITRKKIAALVAVIIISGAVLILTFVFFFSGYLSKTDRVNANLLVVEGWLPPYAIEMAYTEFESHNYNKIITTGIRNSDYFLVYTNGYLIFHCNKILRGTPDTGKGHTIEVNAFSELGNENRAHFRVLINDSAAGDFYADKRKRKYEVRWNGNLSSIDSVMIEFDNDKVSEAGDRNLFVKELIFDHKIHVPYQYNSEYDIPYRDGFKRFRNNYSSFAGLARNRLLALGIDSSLVVAIPGKRVRINRTLTSVIAFRDWLKQSDIKVKGLNIITVGTHARRTWMTYNKVLDRKYPVGIISLPDYIYTSTEKRRLLKTFRETLGIIYYWILLIPY